MNDDRIERGTAPHRDPINRPQNHAVDPYVADESSAA
jgi:hypothetical protein